MPMTLTNNVGSLLRVFDHSSQRCFPDTFHARKWANVHIRVGYGPRRPLLLQR